MIMVEATECKERSYFLSVVYYYSHGCMASESAAGDERSFLVFGRVKTVNRADQTFTYTMFSAVSHPSKRIRLQLRERWMGL